MGRFLILPWLVVAAMALCACIRHQPDGKNVEILRQGELRPVLNTVDIEPTVYVSVRDASGQDAARLAARIRGGVQARGYAIVSNPSEAGYILQMEVLAAGDAAPDAVRAAVAGGYGMSAPLSGDGAKALVADVLLVQRTVPSSRRPHRVRLKNISRRNAVASSQMRLGVLAPKGFWDDGGPSASLAEHLAKDLAAALPQISPATPPPHSP